MPRAHGVTGGRLSKSGARRNPNCRHGEEVPVPGHRHFQRIFQFPAERQGESDVQFAALPGGPPPDQGMPPGARQDPVEQDRMHRIVAKGIRGRGSAEIVP